MTKLRLLSGGAAQGLVSALAPQFEAETGFRIEGTFGAVGARSAELRSGKPADFVILTSALVTELAQDGYIIGSSAADVGVVHTAVAVRTGDTVPAISDVAELRNAFLGADEIYVPDMHKSTAGIHIAKVLVELGIKDEVSARLRAFPDGATAMKNLASSRGIKPIGSTQATEILNTPGVTLAASLPKGSELATTYTAAICTTAEYPDQARRFIKLLTGKMARESRQQAGFT